MSKRLKRKLDRVRRRHRAPGLAPTIECNRESSIDAYSLTGDPRYPGSVVDMAEYLKEMMEEKAIGLATALKILLVVLDDDTFMPGWVAVKFLNGDYQVIDGDRVLIFNSKRELPSV